MVPPSDDSPKSLGDGETGSNVEPSETLRTRREQVRQDVIADTRRRKWLLRAGVGSGAAVLLMIVIGLLWNASEKAPADGGGGSDDSGGGLLKASGKEDEPGNHTVMDTLADQLDRDRANVEDTLAEKSGSKKSADKKSAKKDAAPPTVDSQMRALLQLANQGEFDKSLEQIEVVLARKDLDKVERKKRREFPFRASQIAQALGRQLASGDDNAPAHAAYLASARHFRHLQENFKPLFPQEVGFGSTVFYNEACALASKDTKKARASLVEAVELGFNDFKLLKTDKDLEPLRKAGGFDKFVAQQEAVGARKADEEIGKEMADNKTFPFDFTLPDLDGNPVSLSSFRGKVVIVDVWGTWVQSCRAAVPHFVELQKTYGKQGLQIVGINYERSADPIPGIKSFAKEHGINYPLVIGNEATQNQISESQAFPTTLFVDREGEVRLMAVGARPQSYLEAVVKRLLREPIPADAKK